MSTPSQPDAEKLARLAQTRRWATLVLLVLVAIYLATFLPSQTPEWLRLVRHMAEAGMIGGLADWFAVVALFRHPLGIKIPHTALLPRNKTKAAESVGQFFKSYFLDPEAISARVAEMAPARRAAEWISDPAHAALVAEPLTQALSVALRPEGDLSLPKGLRRELRAALSSDTATDALVSALGPALEAGVGGQALGDTLAQVRVALDGNRDRVLDIVQDNSRWWVASRVDKGVSNTLVNGIIDVIRDLEDEKSQLHQEFEQGLTGLLDRLEETGTLRKAIHDGKAAFAQSAAFDETLETILDLLRARLAEGLASDSTDATGAIAEALQGFGEKLLADPDRLTAFEAKLTKTTETALIELRDPIASYVTEVINGWDADTLSDRFEQEIGPDLQFIRINGAVLGALIGGGFFFLGKALTALGGS